jgi:hypothetical protein
MTDGARQDRSAASRPVALPGACSPALGAALAGAVDVAILTVIPAELLAARAALGIGDDGREKDEGDGTVYLRGAVRSELAGREGVVLILSKGCGLVSLRVELDEAATHQVAADGPGLVSRASDP